MPTINKVMPTLLLLLSFTSNAFSTQEQITITHPEFSEPLTFNITLPTNYAKNTAKSYVMMFNFHHYSDSYLSGMHDWMSHNGEWPWLQTIIVTPAKGNRVGMLFDETGKTTPMLDFFNEQLFPTVDNKYRTNRFRIMSGFRVDATIVLSALINKPDMFNAYIAVSPELKDNYASILSKAKNKLSKLNDKPRFLLFSHGTNVKEAHQMASYEQLHVILKTHAPKKLDWHYQHLADNYFMSLPLVSVINGIEKIFDDIHHGLAPESEIAQQGVEAIIQHYKYLSKDKYGFEVSPKHSINALGFYLLETAQQDGINIFKDMVHRYPKDAYSHHNLASVYAKWGNYEVALKHQKDAVKLADDMMTWHKKRHRRFLANYQSKYDESLK